MNILIATDFDNGGQMHALYRALNKYTSHTARLITFKGSYLNYETDLFDPCLNEVKELTDWAEFFILGELLSPRMHTEPIYDKIQLNNCIIRAGGSLARQHPELYTQDKLGSIVKTGAYHDWTILRQMGVLGNTVNICEFSEWPEKVVNNKDQPVRLVFSGTALKQQSDHSGAYMAAWKILSDIYSKEEVEFITIAGLSWKESLKIKATCDICYDQLKIGTYANSAIEGMYYQMPTFCYICGWCKSIYPNIPVIPYTSVDEIVSTSKKLIDSIKIRKLIGGAGNEFVMDIHDAKNAIKRWESLIEFTTMFSI